MPAMPRIPGKPTDIAYAILGKPDNLEKDKSSKRKRQDKELTVQETVRVR